MMVSRIAACCGCLMAASQAMACFTVLSREDAVVYFAAEPPVDMSRPLHETLPRLVPGGHMVFDLATECSRPANERPHAVSTILRNDSEQLVRVLDAPDPLSDGAPGLVTVPTAALLADLGPAAGRRW